MAQFYTRLLQIKPFGGFYPLTELWNNCHFNLAAMQYSRFPSNYEHICVMLLQGGLGKIEGNWDAFSNI